MSISIWKVTFGLDLNRASNDGGIAAGIDLFKSPYWEVEASIQLLLPWELAFRVSQRIT